MNPDLPKRKRGFPAGTIKRSRMSHENLHKAELMFIAGKSIKEIQKEFKLTSMNILYRHMYDEGWLQKREEFMQSSMQQNLDRILSGALVETDKVLIDLKIIREKAMEPIESGEVSPKRYSEASQAYMDSVELERKIRIEGLQLSFIVEVAQILKQEIQDESILLKIGQKLRRLFENYQRPMLYSGRDDE